MSILHICCNWAGTTVFDSLFSQMASDGLNQIVYVPEKRKEDLGHPATAKENLKVFSSLVIKPQDKFLFYTKARRSVPDILQKVDLSGVRLIHAHTVFTDGNIAYELSRRTGLPYMVTLRSTDINYFYRYMPHLRPRALKILLGAKAVICVSPTHRDALLARRVPKAHRAAIGEKTHVIPNGIPADWLDGSPRHYAPGDPVHIAFAGKLNHIKQPLMAVEATQALAGRLPGVSCRLTIAGDGPLMEALRAHPAVAAGSVHLAGRIGTRQGLKDLYDSATLFLLPSKVETFGLVYLEAMSRGVPVLYTKGQGFDGQYPEGEVGYHVDPHSPGGIADAALRLLGGDYDTRSRRCIKEATGRTWALMAARHEALYAPYLA